MLPEEPERLGACQISDSWRLKKKPSRSAGVRRAEGTGTGAGGIEFAIANDAGDDATISHLLFPPGLKELVAVGVTRRSDWFPALQSSSAWFRQSRPATFSKRWKRRRGEQILATLKKSNWVAAGPDGAAARLGLKLSTLQSRMRKLGIGVTRSA
jgi:hypothetical protein